MKKQTRVPITFTIDPELKKRIEDAAAADNRTVSNWIECMILKALEGTKNGIKK